MKIREAVAKLDAIDADPEMAHSEADDVLLEFVPEAVRDAYTRVKARSDWWAAG